MDLQTNQNFAAFEVYTKEHYQEMLCAAEKERNLAFLKTRQRALAKPIRKRRDQRVAVPAVQLEECSISPSFWLNQL